MTGRFTPRGAHSLNPSLNPSPRASLSGHDDASLPLVLCSLLQKEFSGARSPVVGGVGPMGITAGIPLPTGRPPVRRRVEERNGVDDG